MKLIAPILVGAVLLAPAGPNELEILVARLGAPRYADREAASRELEKMGTVALPVLREARSGPDAEVKSRAEGLLDAIERAMLTRATTLRFEGEGQGVSRAEAARRIEASQRIDLPLAANDRPIVAPLRGESGGSIEFWPLLDRLGLTLEVETGERGNADRRFTMVSRRSGAIRLVDKTRTDSRTSDSGPFRLIARPPNLAASGGGFRREAARPAELVVPIHLWAEPRLSIRGAGGIRVVEAIDENGADVAPDGLGINFAVSGGERSQPTLDLEVRLRAPGNRRLVGLKRLRGVVPVEVEARRIDPAVVRLERDSDDDYPPVVNGGNRLQVIRLSEPALGVGDTYTLEVTVRPEGWVSSRPGRRAAQRQVWEFTSSDTHPFWPLLEVVDATGRPIPIVMRRGIGEDADGVRVLLDLAPRPDGQVPAEVRLHARITDTVEVPFDFHDIPAR